MDSPTPVSVMEGQSTLNPLFFKAAVSAPQNCSGGKAFSAPYNAVLRAWISYPSIYAFELFAKVCESNFFLENHVHIISIVAQIFLKTKPILHKILLACSISILNAFL